MTEMEKRVPELRFKGFIEDWEQRKFEDGTSKIGDGLHGTPEYSENGEVAFINGNNLVNGKIVINDQTKFVTSEQQSRTDAELNENTILMSINGTIGNLAWFRGEKLMLGKSAAYIEVNSFHKKFIYQLLQTHKIRNYFLNNLTGTTIKNLGLKTIRETPILIPKVDEQQKIGSFFERLDDTIALHQRKLTSLKQLKQTYLQVLFPHNGENIPALRFVGFSKPWEQRKSSEVFKSVSDKNHPELQVLSASQEKGMVLRDDIGIDIKYDKKSLGTYKRVLPDQFVIHLRSFQGGFAYSFVEGITSPAYTVLDFKERNKYYSLFWRLALSSRDFIKRLETVTYGIRDGRSISYNDFSTLTFYVPSINEQKKIGDFLDSIESTISLHQQKVNQLHTLQRTLLNKMFI